MSYNKLVLHFYIVTLLLLLSRYVLSQFCTVDMPRKRKVPRSARSIRQKNHKYETQCNNMEASSDSIIPPLNNQPLNVEPQVVACDQKISTRASLRLKRSESNPMKHIMKILKLSVLN